MYTAKKILQMDSKESKNCQKSRRLVAFRTKSRLQYQDGENQILERSLEL